MILASLFVEGASLMVAAVGASLLFELTNFVPAAGVLAALVERASAVAAVAEYPFVVPSYPLAAPSQTLQAVGDARLQETHVSAQV